MDITINSTVRLVPLPPPGEATATFGALTLASAGDYQVRDSGGNPVTGASVVETGTASGYTLSAGGIITASGNGSLSAQNGNTIVVSSDQGTITVTLSVEANAYTCANAAQTTAAFLAALAADTGATLRCRAGGDYTGTFGIDVQRNKTAHVNRVTISADDANNKPVFDVIHLKNNAALTFDNLEITRDPVTTFQAGLALVLNGSGPTWDRRIAFTNCDIHGPRSPGGVTTSFTDETPINIGDGGIENWPDYGVTTAGGDTGNHALNIEVRDCKIYYVVEAISCGPVQSRLDIIGNEITYFSGDCIKAPAGPQTFNCLWNKIGFNVGRNGDLGGTLHGDAIQWQGQKTQDSTGATIVGNLFLSGDLRGNPLQLIFGDDWGLISEADADDYGLSGALIAYNIGHARGSNAGIKQLHAKSLTVHDNLFVTHSNDATAILIQIGSDHTEGAHVVKYNAADGFILETTSDNSAGTATVDASDNYQPRTVLNYADEFVGPAGGDFTVSPASFDELMAWFAAKPGGTLFTANKNGGPLGTNNSRVDYVNRTYTALSA